MHDSGTGNISFLNSRFVLRLVLGGSPSLGLFSLFPYAGCAGDDVNGCAYPKKTRAIPFDNSSVVATPGYFGLTLNSGVKADMTVTQHTSLFRLDRKSVV